MDKAICPISSAGPCELNLNWVVDIKVTLGQLSSEELSRKSGMTGYTFDLENLKSLQLSGNFRDPGFLTQARRVSA